MDRKVPAILLRILMDSYRRQELRAKWHNSFSKTFTTLNGIKQGSITSPVLFTIYMDYLLLELERSGFGCKIGGHYFGALSYADDLTLISPTLSGLQSMLNLCEQFGLQFGVKYNPTKSVVMCVGRKEHQLPNLQLANQPLQWVPVVKHLGNYVRSDLKETCEITHKRGDLIGRVNSMCATFAGANNNVKQEIFNTQCSHFYGSEAWNMSAPEFNTFRKTWNHGIRKVFGLPYETHTRYLEFLIGRPYITDQLYRRFYRLLINMGQSSNRKVSFLTKFLFNDSSSLMCRNVQCIARRYKLNYYERLQKQYTICSFIVRSSHEDERFALQIQEL